ncbi:MAG: Re/Si-specific NAD(P)(+) transhydrogenase subunit alpha [Verrucomicrobia bacterium]|nr:Re/Si-specific NAD(P)(+) transhydrogenase subunit alpha [Verrucomicrobiota bacterium]MDA1086932.1 Re/Si-specific NAD(P)(+) transhydrogenase subunit alpha [Verrucomicrobiota bacterium]
MIIGVAKETTTGDYRVPLIPIHVEKLVGKGAEIRIEPGLGDSIRVTDEEYTSAGAKVAADRKSLLAESDILLRVRKPPEEEVGQLKKGSLHISHLDPFNEADLLKQFADANVSSISMELIPRTTRAQKMDSLSSQANLAGYVTVILAAARIDRVLPMMMTPAGTLSPARVFIIGAGVAGLQAIATAKRLGARVEAFDVRPEAAEQIESLGAKSVKIDIGETGSTKDGYAKQLTPEQLEMQRKGMAKICANADIVITTAQVFGRKAPVIVTADMVEGMKPGSVVVDMAVEGGGNVEGSKLNEEIEVNGVRVIGLGNLPSHVASHASQMYSANLFNLLDEFWDEESKEFKLDLEDEIIRGCLVTHGGELVNEKVKGVIS